jgi:integral membrane sensor domain MASE1
MASPALPSRRIGDPERGSYARISHALPVALLTALAYYFGSQIGFLFTPIDSPIALFWPPNAILLSVLLLTPKRIWPLLLLAVFPAHLLIQLKTGIPLNAALGWFAGNTGEAVVGALGVRMFCKERSPFESVQGVIIFTAFGIAVATLLTSFIDAANTVGTGLGSAFWQIWSSRLASNTLSDITVVPFAVFLGLKGRSYFRNMAPARFVEASLLVLGLVAVSLAVYGEAHSRSFLLFAPVPFFIWAAMRFGSAGLSVTLLIAALISLWNVLHGRGPLQNTRFEDQALALQTLLTLCGLPLLLLSATTVERETSEQTARKFRASVAFSNERERQSIARKLRDEIVQELSLVGSSIDELRARPDTSTSAWDEIQQQISTATLAATKLSHNLHPYTVDYLGLVDALRALCDEFEHTTGIATNLSADREIEMPVTSAYALFRVARETLGNTAAYEGVDLLRLELRRIQGDIELRFHAEGSISELEARTNSRLAYLREEMLLAPGTLAVSSGAPNKLRMIARVTFPKNTPV